MMRSIGVVETLQKLVPEVLAVVLAPVTYAGSPGLAVAVAVAVYWFEDREGGMRLLGYLAGGLAVAFLLKTALALPRPATGPLAPPGEVPRPIRSIYAGEASADGYGFPSGHAVTSTVTYGGLALVLDRSTPRRRTLVAGGLVVAVGLSRLLLGVHFFVDVAVGTAVGLCYLFAVRRTVDLLPDRHDLDRTTGTLVVGSALLVGAAVLGHHETVDVLGVVLSVNVFGAGAAVGALLAWYRIDVPLDPWPASLPAVLGVLAGTAGFCLAVGASLAVGGHPVVLFVGSTLGMGTLVALPARLP